VFLRNIIISLILCSSLACDQLSKNIARESLRYDEQIKLLNDRLTLAKVENTGAFLSFGESMPEWLKFLFLVMIPLLVLASGIFYLFGNKNLTNAYTLGLCLVIGGGAGNIYDRIIYGSVTDFLHLDFGLFQTGVFNLADVSVMFGILILLCHIMIKKTVDLPDQDNMNPRAGVL